MIISDSLHINCWNLAKVRWPWYMLEIMKKMCPWIFENFVVQQIQPLAPFSFMLNKKFLYFWQQHLCKYLIFFFSIKVFFHGHWQLIRQQRKGGGTIFYFTLPLPPAHEHSNIYLQLCTWDDYHILVIATLVFTRLLLDGIYHLIELRFDWLMMWCWFLFVCSLNWF